MHVIASKLLPSVVILVTIYFFASVLKTNWENVRSLSLGFGLLEMGGVSLLILSVIFSGLLWGSVLNQLSDTKKISPKDAVRIHLLSWLLKYIPGQVGSYLNKLTWGIKHDISKATITNSFIYENFLLVFASILPTIPIVVLAFSNKLNDNYQILIPLLLALPLLVVVNKRTFYNLASWLLRKFGRKKISISSFLSGRQLAVLQAQFLVPRVLNGLGFVLIASSLLTVTADMYIPLGAIYVLAGITGVLAVFVPSGIGVREAVIVLFASNFFPLEQAIALSLIARFYATIADVGVFVMYLMLNEGKIKQI